MSKSHLIHCDDTCLHEATIEELLEQLASRLKEIRQTTRQERYSAPLPEWLRRLKCNPKHHQVAIRFLQAMDCPEEIIHKLDEWVNLPSATPERLERWTASQIIRQEIKP